MARAKKPVLPVERPAPDLPGLPTPGRSVLVEIRFSDLWKEKHGVSIRYTGNNQPNGTPIFEVMHGKP